MAKLTFVLEQGQEVVVPLEDAVTLTLGRGDDNDVVVDDARVSTHHAALERDADGRVEVRDLNSSAGTFVNGERVQSRCIVHGDTLAFGPLTAVFDVEELQSYTNGHASALDRMQSAVIRPDPSRKNRRGEQPQQEALAQLESEKTRLQSEVAAVQAHLHDWQARAARELRDHTTRMDTLQAEQRRLAHVNAAVKEAQALHQQWTEAVKTLSTEFEEKTLEVQRLTSTEATARHEVEALATHKDQALAHLNQVREECEHADAHLAALRQELPELEERSQRLKDLADAREDQVKLAEKKLEQIAGQRTRVEAHIRGLTGIEEKLAQAQISFREAEAAHTALSAELPRLQGSVKELQQAVATLEETRAAKQHTEKALHTLQAELKTRQTDLATATQQLEEITARRADLARQCAELADTEQKLAAATHRHTELTATLTADEERHAVLQESVTSLQSKEVAIKGRLEVLHGREQDLRSELTKLSASEHSSRDRFEEFQQLISAAEKEHAAQHEEHTHKIKAARHEMEELESKLEPLRDWTEAMDLLYVRLAELPEDSPEARDLWREIEKEKADLKALIANARSFMPKKATTAAKTAPAKTPAKAAAQPVPAAAEPPPLVEPKVNGTGLVLEQTLKSRLSYLRENVQREESRLEFLRHERTRHEIRSRVGGPAGEAMKREHDRHLEAKIRHDEEHLRALHQTLELTKTEEEKRRGKIAEMERKLTELHAGITEAERHRSDLRHQADLAHTELKNFEATLERLKKMADSEVAQKV